MSVIRAFIAIELSADIQRKLEQVTGLLRGQIIGAPVRWVPVHNIHLTLKFLGNVSVANLGILEKILLSEMKRWQPFEISVGEVGAFPSTRRPRVIWTGVQSPPELGQLQHSLEEQVERLGYPPEERGFSPHLTFGRVSRNASNAEVQQIGQVVEAAKVGFMGAMRVEVVHLFRSDLQPGGSVYTRLYSANLGTTETA
jgi:2'-5' RNA ligase